MQLHKLLTIIILASHLSLSANSASSANPANSAVEATIIVLTSKVLKFIDGISHAMDGHTILDMKIISGKMRNVIYGHLDPHTKKRIGLFEFQGKKASLHMLARIEDRIQSTYRAAREDLEQKHIADITHFNTQWQLREQALIEQCDDQLHKLEEEILKKHKTTENREIAMKQAKRNVLRKHEQTLAKELDALKRAHILDFELFSLELEELDQKRTQQLSLLSPALAEAKKAFSDITFPFMEQARGSKDFMVPLIEEWAERAGHKDSMLLRWSEEDAGSELKMFDQDITTCGHLNDMCSNLLDFLTSLIASCPHAVEQYEILKNKLSAHHDPS